MWDFPGNRERAWLEVLEGELSYISNCKVFTILRQRVLLELPEAARPPMSIIGRYPTFQESLHPHRYLTYRRALFEAPSIVPPIQQYKNECLGLHEDGVTFYKLSFEPHVNVELSKLLLLVE